jgi:hypothetical protein
MSKINWNEKFVFTNYENSVEWEKGYRVYIQKIKDYQGKWSIPFVTFSNKIGEKLHFNDSLSINIEEYYGSADTLIDMIRYARSVGWIKEMK